MKSRYTLVLSIGCLLAVTSCGPSNPVTHEVDQFLPIDDPTSDVTINFWHCLGGQNTDNLDDIVQEFNSIPGNHYKVKLKALAGDYDSLHDTIKTNLASGSVPALAMGYPDSFSVYMTKNIAYSSILRLNNFMEDEEFGLKDIIDDFVPGYIEEGQKFQFEGTWSLPMYKSTEALYYNYSYFNGLNPCNSKKFEKSEYASQWTTLSTNASGAGTADPVTFEEDMAALREFVEEHDGYTYEVPETWNEMFTLARQMRADRTEMGVSNKGFNPVGYDSDANMLISQMAERGIPYTTEQGSGAAHFLFNNSQTKALLDEIVGYYNEGLLMTKNTLGGKTYTDSHFKEQDCVMSIGSTGGSKYQATDTFCVRVAPKPYSGSAPKYIQQGPSICFFDNKNPYIHKGAWEFYKFMVKPENILNLALNNSYDPVRKSSFDLEAYDAWIAKEKKGLQYAIPALTKTFRDKDVYLTSPVFYGSSEARRQIGSTITYITKNKVSSSQALSMAYNACKSAA